MLTIQQVGLEVLQKNPRKLYIFGGSEYGIKSKYIQILTDHYGERKEVSRVADIVELMTSKRLVPLKPVLYVVRYDEQFISELTPAYASKVARLNTIGTLIVIYEQAAHVAKCDKHLPDNTVSIDKVDTKFIVKYLSTDFPKLPQNLIQLVAQSANDYGHAQKICIGLSAASNMPDILTLTDVQIKKLFGIDQVYSEQILKMNVASRNYIGLCKLVDEYADNLDTFLYTILATLVELEKLKCNTYAQSNLREYVKLWTLKDIYNMFNHTYEALQKLRSITSNATNMIMYLISLLVFQEIPDVEVLKCS